MKISKYVAIIALFCGINSVSTAFATTGVPEDNAVIANVAASQSPLGLWTTMDNLTQQPEALVRITETSDHTLVGKVTKIYDLLKRRTVCAHCPEGFQSKPVVGMQVLWGLRQSSSMTWEDGHLLSPKRGQVYACNATLSQDGQFLIIRIYSEDGLSTTRTWYRAV